MIRTGIYLIRNIINQKIYVGSTVNIENRWREHLHGLRHKIHENSHLQRTWNKYGEDAFEFRVLFYCLPEDLIENEQMVIDIYKEEIGWNNMYNVMPFAGSSRGIKQSPETLAKLSAIRKGKKRTLETKAKISATMKGMKRTPENCANMSAGRRGKKLKPHTPEQRARQSKALKGKPWSKARREAQEKR